MQKCALFASYDRGARSKDPRRQEKQHVNAAAQKQWEKEETTGRAEQQEGLLIILKLPTALSTRRIELIDIFPWAI
jgi:hypothetical protein